MTEIREYPLSIRDVAPHPEAVRLTGTNPDGTPNGFHTGGAWLWNDEVWKPLDGRPFANCEHHYSTQEDEVLELMADKPLFPRNWRVAEANGRRFLVRQKAHIVEDFTDLDDKQVLQVEQAVRFLNAAGWEIGDPITLALDPKTYRLFIVDLSNAHPRTGTGAFAADDSWRIESFFKMAGREWFAKFRRNAHEAACGLEFFEQLKRGYAHTYASFNRPIDGGWASIDDVLYIHTEKANWPEAKPHTWVISKSPLDDETLRRYELRWGWSPVAA